MYRCKACGSSLGLDARQVRSLPEPLAACPEGRPTTFLERFLNLSGGYDCLVA